jgi:predicted nucleic acid-binding protein
MTQVLCDTNIFIEVYRQNFAVRAMLETIGYGNIAVSDVTRAELFYGAANKVELKKIRSDLNKIPVYPVDAVISQMAVSLVEQFCLSHKTDLPDALIAATAVLNNMELYTLNVKDFIFIPGIRLYHR